MRNNFTIEINEKDENVRYVRSSLEVYNHTSPEAYYIYMNLINSNPNKFTPNFGFYYYMMGQSKARKGLDELQELGLLEIRKIGNRKFAWIVKYTFDDEKGKAYAVPEQVVKKRKIKEEEKEVIQEKINQIDINIEALKMLLESAVGKEYEDIQTDIINLEQERKALKR